MSEHQFHKVVAEYLDYVLRPTTWWSSIPAGEGGGPVRGARWKAKGAKAGLPDILIVHDSRCFFIELKDGKKGKLSKAQENTHEDIKAAGGCVAVCRTIEDVQNLIGNWGIR